MIKAHILSIKNISELIYPFAEMKKSNSYQMVVCKLNKVCKRFTVKHTIKRLYCYSEIKKYIYRKCLNIMLYLLNSRSFRVASVWTSWGSIRPSAGFCTWISATPSANTGWEIKGEGLRGTVDKKLDMNPESKVYPELHQKNHV